MSKQLVPYAPPPAISAAYRARGYTSLVLAWHAEARERRARMATVAPLPAVPPKPAARAEPAIVLRAWKPPADPRVVEANLTVARGVGHPSMADIQRTCAEAFGVTRDDILGSRRTASIVAPRQVAVFVAKHLTQQSLPEIGRRFGGRDHTTVLHAIRKTTRRIATDGDFAARVGCIFVALVGDA